MKKIIYKFILLTGIFFCAAVILNSCSKADANINSSAAVKEYFLNNMLGRDLTVAFAKDENTAITAMFAGYNFRFTATTASAGTATVSNDLFAVNGTWDINTTNNTINFNFPVNIITSLVFINKEWLFANRNAATIILTATNGETDELHFVIK
ncbi:MAG: hypothetical protein RIR31_973 [Bacteroidota bacterium]|jgi:hypothetical protein